MRHRHRFASKEYRTECAELKKTLGMRLQSIPRVDWCSTTTVFDSIDWLIIAQLAEGWSQRDSFRKAQFFGFLDDLLHNGLDLRGNCLLQRADRLSNRGRICD